MIETADQAAGILLEECWYCDGDGTRGEKECPWCEGSGCQQVDPFIVQVPCSACFESCGYEVEFGTDWESGPWSHQTNRPCGCCHGTGSVDGEPIDIYDLAEMAGDHSGTAEGAS